jgi:predicted nucleic acid-binding protein
VTAVLVDSNVLLDLLTDDERWTAWSAAALARLGATAQLVINPIIFAEVSVRAATVEDADAAFPEAFFRREPIPWAAAFLAGKAYLAYQRRGGTRRAPLPDFFIGAHAAVAGYRLLTRDTARYRTYFPTLELIAPS